MIFEKKREAPKSLFDIAASRYGKKKPSKEETVPQSLKTNEQEAPQDITALFERAKRLHEEIELRIDSLLRYHDISEQKFYRYLSEPKNFTQDEWTRLEVEREANKRRIKELCDKLPTGGDKAFQKYLERAKQSEQKVDAMRTGKASPTGQVPPKKKPLSRREWLNMH